jgi:flagellar protein FlgJ
MQLAFDPHMAHPRQAEPGGDSDPNGKRAGLKGLCQDFEAILIHTFLRQMRETVPEDGYLDAGMGQDLFQDMMDMEVAREMARKGGFGLGRLLYQQFQNDAGGAQK